MQFDDSRNHKTQEKMDAMDANHKQCLVIGQYGSLLKLIITNNQYRWAPQMIAESV